MHKKPLTIGEYLALPANDKGECAAERSAELAEIQKGWREAVADVATHWNGKKYHGTKFQNWKPAAPAKKTIHKRTDKNKPTVEPHYDVIEISSAWGMSTDLVRRLFRNEPGVLTIERPATRSKRGYSTIRVPESVMVRVHTRLSARA